MQYKLSNMK